ncbi:MAG: carbohydrate kinase family protein [Deltaproteobacteria bacterium]|nr:carbohydrate kinase family protein [Deltaproteobacteria bacterium]
MQIVDSVGAGDSFTAAVSLGLLKGFSLEKINRTASSVASYVCSKKGATPIIPEEIISSMK